MQRKGTVNPKPWSIEMNKMGVPWAMYNQGGVDRKFVKTEVLSNEYKLNQAEQEAIRVSWDF